LENIFGLQEFYRSNDIPSLMNIKLNY